MELIIMAAVFLFGFACGFAYCYLSRKTPTYDSFNRASSSGAVLQAGSGYMSCFTCTSIAKERKEGIYVCPNGHTTRTRIQDGTVLW